MKNSVYIALAGAMVGCATQPSYMWVRGNTTQADFEMDRMQCLYEAEKAVATYGSSAPTERTLGGAIGQGMAIGFGKAMEGNNLAVLCMKARGYRQAPVDLDAVARIRAEPAAIAPVPIASRPPPPPTAATPAAATGNTALLNKPSKYLYTAEQFAKAGGCVQPVAVMVLQTPGAESFAVACASGEQRAIRCDYGVCQAIE